MKKLNFSDIKILVFDVDGILTDGKIYLSEDGTETKTFFTRDGAGMKLAKKLGFKVGMISARISKAAAFRASELGVDFYIEGCKEKYNALKPILQECGMGTENLFYMGDDIVDLELLKLAAISATVPDAPEYIKLHADVITGKQGGFGAVREVCDMVLEGKGLLSNFLNKL
jgi:3-deoxy-D-manno-octulosonate 8-phosphate phosphatase (KDO 8-P phosphatase)